MSEMPIFPPDRACIHGPSLRDTALATARAHTSLLQLGPRFRKDSSVTWAYFSQPRRRKYQKGAIAEMIISSKAKG
jgi:hypothetical protein